MHLLRCETTRSCGVAAQVNSGHFANPQQFCAATHEGLPCRQTPYLNPQQRRPRSIAVLIHASGFSRSAPLPSAPIFVVSGILNQVAHNLAIDLDAPGNVVSSYSLAYGPSGPILAALTGRFRKDRVVLMAIALFAVANALCAIAPTYATIITARIVTGLAAGLYTPTAYALAASIASPERKASALAAVALGITVSFVAGVPLGMVVGSQFGWHASFWLIGAFSLIAFAAIGLLPPRGLKSGTSRLSLIARFAPPVQPRTLLP